MRFGSSGSVLKHLRQNRTKRSVGRKIRVHHRKGALVIGANANVDPLLSAQAGDASDFDAPAFAGYDAVFDRDRNLGYVERGGDFRLEDRGWRAGSLRRNRGCQRGAIDGPHRWFRQEQLRPPSNDASFVVLYEQIDAGGIVAVRKNERLSERAIGRAVEQHRPCAIGIDRCTPRARRDRHLQGGRAAHGQVPATWRAGDRRVVQKRVPERLTLLPRQELQRLLQPVPRRPELRQLVLRRVLLRPVLLRRVQRLREPCFPCGGHSASRSAPHDQRKTTSRYSGWMSDFMALTIVTVRVVTPDL
ncbi:hypothetical protein GQR58_030422 [Nymphon striatum]|nr:hypothetical protein GQR58_030422 [Nymphon striatum]